jgi:hypothetical protein
MYQEKNKYAFQTVSDAMYLAGLMADEHKITESLLDEWIDNAY